eukprot:4207020-Prymnesium_polylepis.1
MCVPLRRASLSRACLEGLPPSLVVLIDPTMSSSARGEAATRHGAAQDAAAEDRHGHSADSSAGARDTLRRPPARRRSVAEHATVASGMHS